MTRLRGIERLTLRTRITLLLAVAVAAAVAVTSIAAYLTARHELREQLANSTLARAKTVVAGPLLPRLLSDPSTQDAALLQIQEAALAAGAVDLGLVDPAGNVSNANLPASGAEVDVATGVRADSVRITGGYSLAAVHIPRTSQALLLAQSTDQIDSTLRTLAWFLVGLGVMGVALASLIGVAAARAGLRPVERLTDAAERVTQTGRLDPIDVQGDDELARLARSFNAMLGALSAARQRERQLVADAGHELRTPLTSLRTNLDLLAQSDAAGRQLAPADRSELLSDVRAQLGELSGLVDDLVELSREGTTAAQVAPVDLAGVVSRAVDRVRLRNAALHYDIDTAPWFLIGDEALLERAVTNLLDNAAKWSPAGGTVTVRLADGALTVADEGPGISEQDAPHVFDRFYRAPDARALPGSGLGLSIVARAAQQHGGQVAVSRSAGGGALLRFALPGTPTPPATS